MVAGLAEYEPEFSDSFQKSECHFSLCYIIYAICRRGVIKISTYHVFVFKRIWTWDLLGWWWVKVNFLRRGTVLRFLDLPDSCLLLFWRVVNCWFLAFLRALVGWLVCDRGCLWLCSRSCILWYRLFLGESLVCSCASITIFVGFTLFISGRLLSLLLVFRSCRWWCVTLRSFWWLWWFLAVVLLCCWLPCTWGWCGGIRRRSLGRLRSFLQNFSSWVGRWVVRGRVCTSLLGCWRCDVRWITGCIERWVFFCCWVVRVCFGSSSWWDWLRWRCVFCILWRIGLRWWICGWSFVWSRWCWRTWVIDFFSILSAFLSISRKIVCIWAIRRDNLVEIVAIEFFVGFLGGCFGWNLGLAILAWADHPRRCFRPVFRSSLWQIQRWWFFQGGERLPDGTLRGCWVLSKRLIWVVYAVWGVWGSLRWRLVRFQCVCLKFFSTFWLK